MINDTLKEIEEEFDREFGIYTCRVEIKQSEEDITNNLPQLFTNIDKPIKSFLKSSIIKVLQQLMEREEKAKILEIMVSEGTTVREKSFYNKSKDDTISYLKSEIANLSTNIDKE